MMRFGLVLSGLALVCSAVAQVDPQEAMYGPWHEFRTEPTFKAAVLEISRPKGKDGLMSANHHIITTLRSFSGHGPWGPQIFDGSGHLVFYSDPNHLGLAIQDPHICTFGGESSPTHLCASKVLQQLDGHMDTEPVIYDSGYEQVNPSFERIGSLGSADGHDFNVLDRGKTYLSTVYGKKMARLADVPGGGGLPDNWVYDACFQEVEVESAKSIVEWCYLDHFSIDETLLNLGAEEFQRRPVSEQFPFDFAHINSVDKDAEGNYLVSLKYLNQIIKLAGPDNSLGIAPGSAIWRLGGHSNQFHYGSPDVKFAYQHHARWLRSNESAPNTEMIALFDNQCDDPTLASCTAPSSGKVIMLNHNDSSASLVHRFLHPEGKASWTGGSIQHLKNGNFFISWGQLPEVSEFDGSNGDLLMHTRLGASALPFQYRSSLAKWRGFPTWSPKVLPYLKSCGGEDPPEVEAGAEDEKPLVKPNKGKPALHLYMSWNGATQYSTWRISASTSGVDGSFVDIGNFPKTGFETHVSITCDAHVGNDTESVCYMPYIVATAVDAKGHWLPHSKSEITRTFIPDPQLLEQGVCNEASCNAGFIYDDSISQMGSCIGGSTRNWHKLMQVEFTPGTLVLFCFTLAILSIFVKSMIGCVRIPSRVPSWKRSQGWSKIMTDEDEESGGFKFNQDKSVRIAVQDISSTSPMSSPCVGAWQPGHRSRPSYTRASSGALKL